MEEKKTCDLDKIFENAKINNVPDFLKENKGSMKDSKKEFYYYMKNVIESKNIMLKNVYINSRVDENYAGKIIRMEKHTSNRDFIIRLCLAGQFTLDETNRALKLYGMNPLYSRIPRDACLIVVINNRKYDIDEINEFLEENDVEKFIIKED